MTGQGRRRSVVTAALVGVTCGLSWLGIRNTSVGAAAVQLQAPQQQSVDDRADPLPPARFRKPGPLALAPVPGLTVAWHHAPEETAIPLGTVLRFFQPAPAGDVVTWTGARQVRREVYGSLAECPLSEIGMQEVRVEIVDPAKPERPPTCYAARLDVMDISVNDIQVATIEASVDPMELDENSTNEETVYYFFNVPSVAALRRVGDGLYRTSIDREIEMTVQVDPPGFAPLMEWRIDDRRLFLSGGPVRQAFMNIGTHTIAVGLPAQRRRIEIETYSVTITGQFEGDIPEGEPVLFEAVTDPPGFENDVTWFSSTKFGTAVPVLGQGPTFTVQFDDTWGPHPDGGRWRWVGVKGDNARLGHDNRDETGCCLCGNGALACFESPDCVQSRIECETFCRNRTGVLCFACPDDDCVATRGATCRKAPHRKIVVRHFVKRPVGRFEGDCRGQLIDPWTTVPVTDFEFGGADFPAIPAGFFGPGSEKFSERFDLEGVPLGRTPFGDFGDADTLVRRDQEPFDRCEVPPFPGAVAVDIEIVALSLKSSAPITVHFEDGTEEEWDVHVTLSETHDQELGTLTATKEHCNGGTFVLNALPVVALFTFTREGEEDKQIDTGDVGDPLVLSNEVPSPWAHDVEGEVPSCTDSRFHPGVDSFPEPDCDCNDNGRRDICDVPESEGCPQGTCDEEDDPPCSRDDDQDCIPDECP